MKKGQKLIIITAVCLCVLLFAAYFAILHFRDSDGDKGDKNEDGAETLIEFNKTEKISSLAVSSGELSLSLSRINGRWYFTDNRNVPLSDTSVANLISNLEYITVIRTVSQSIEDPAEYGLDTPLCTLSFTLDGAERVYTFGNKSAHYDGYYFSSSESEGVSIVSSSFYESFKVEPESLIEHAVLPDLSKPKSLTLESASGNTLSLDCTDPLQSEHELCTLIASLKIGKYIDFGSEVFGVYGIDRAATLTVDGELTIRLAEGESREIVYLLIGQSEVIYLAECNDLEKLIDFINY